MLVHWTWASVHAACTCLVNYADVQITLNTDLAGQTHVRRKLGFDRKSIPFELSHFTRFAFQNLDATSGATSVPTATVKNIDTRVFKRQHEFLSLRRVSFNRTSSSFSGNFWHGTKYNHKRHKPQRICAFYESCAFWWFRR